MVDDTFSYAEDQYSLGSQFGWEKDHQGNIIKWEVIQRIDPNGGNDPEINTDFRAGISGTIPENKTDYLRKVEKRLKTNLHSFKL